MGLEFTIVGEMEAETFIGICRVGKQLLTHLWNSKTYGMSNKNKSILM